jgi:formamidase
VYLPVHVPGAKFSVGDLHFSQGDGEISFCGAIEMAGVITINFKVIKNGLADLGLKSPIYIPGPVEPQFGPGRYIYFEGFSVDEAGRQRTFHSYFAISPFPPTRPPVLPPFNDPTPS